MSEQQNASVFGEYSGFYDLLYSDKDYAAETRYIDSLLKQFGLEQCSLLEFGSGTGIHGRMLGELGYRVTGIEKSPDMVARAVETGNFNSRVGDIRDTRLPTRFDCVISLFHVVSYLPTNDDVFAVFRNAHAHLDDGGYFIFDVWYSPCVNHLRPEVRTKRMRNDELELIRIAEPEVHDDANRVDVKYTIFSKRIADERWSMMTETHSMRHFSTPEIEFVASQAGFTLVGAEEFLTASAPGKDTWGVCYILKKTA